MNEKDIIKARLLLLAKAKTKEEYPKVQQGREVWFFHREKHFIGQGVVLHVYPHDIGHGFEGAFCEIQGKAIAIDNSHKYFKSVIMQDDVRDSKREAILGLSKALGEQYDLYRGKMVDTFYIQENWRQKL